jgi:ATP-dependent Clp protease protease subunit
MASGLFYVKFLAPVTAESVNALMQSVDRKIAQGAKQMSLLISTPGGDVFQGLSAYNYLKGVPLEISTQNFGSVDSIGVVLYCAGTRRWCVPQARFLLHGVMANFPGPVSLEERQLEERLKGLQLDMGSIARIVANATARDPQMVIRDMRNHLTLTGEEAVSYGLVHEIRSELYETGAEVISIQMGAPAATPFPAPQNPPQGFPPNFPYKPPQN